MDGPTPSTHRPLSDPLVRSATPGSDRAGAPGSDRAEAPGSDRAEAPGSDRAEAPGSDRAQAPALVHLRRPDGRLQVGLGPRAWLVQGWPSTRSSAAGEAAASGLVRALAGAGGTSAGVGASLPPYRVVGHGVLAHRVRTHLAVGGAESDDGVVVLVSAYAVPVGTARQPDLAAAPVLPVVAQTHRVVIGPWAGLGRGPCLHCLDLHRTDGDPAWPTLAAALDPRRHEVTLFEEQPGRSGTGAALALWPSAVRALSRERVAAWLSTIHCSSSSSSSAGQPSQAANPASAATSWIARRSM